MEKDALVTLIDYSRKVILTTRNEVSTINVKTTQGSINNDERLPVCTKELVFCELYPQTLAHSPNRRFVTVCSDEEYTVHTALNLGDKSFGSADKIVRDISARKYTTRVGNRGTRVFGKCSRNENRCVLFTRLKSFTGGGGAFGSLREEFYLFLWPIRLAPRTTRQRWTKGEY